MRATCRKHVLALVGAAAVGCLAGTGCESQKYLVPNASAGPGLSADRTAAAAPRNEVAMLAPRPTGDGALAPQGSGSSQAPVAIAAPRAVGTDPSVAQAGAGAAVVWRASPRGLHADADEDAGPVVPVSWNIGSAMHGTHGPAPQHNDLPKELKMVTLPPYRIEPPDILLINGLRIIPKPPYRVEPLDELLIQAPEAQLIPKEPVNGVYPVGPDGQVDLGYSYGKVMVAGMTPEQARAAISKHIADVHGIKAPAVSVALGQTRGLQQVRGEHLVRMDGTVSLGIYGEAYVAGMTLAEAKQAIEAQMARTLANPEVTVDVLAYNSKVYYVIYDGGGYGQQVVKLPIVGGEKVLDAISQLNGLPAVSSTKRIWIARPTPDDAGCRQVLPVDWAAITEAGATSTNYEIFPGDRIYIKADGWVAFNNKLSKVLAPFERMLGFTLLGNATIRAVDGQANGNGANGGNIGVIRLP